MVERADITVRPFLEGDLAPTAEIYFKAVQVGAAQHYSAEQRNAWASKVPEREPWADRLRAQQVSIAAAADRPEVPVGFITVTADGLVDLAFVDPAWARCGVGGQLHDAVLTWARTHGLPMLTTEASLVARPFFERHGWVVEEEQTVQRAGVALTNFRMLLRLRA